MSHRSTDVEQLQTDFYSRKRTRDLAERLNWQAWATVNELAHLRGQAMNEYLRAPVIHDAVLAARNDRIGHAYRRALARVQRRMDAVKRAETAWEDVTDRLWDLRLSSEGNRA